MPRRKPQILRIDQRKLGKHQAWGRYSPPEKAGQPAVIEIDPRQSAKQELDTLIHEALHHVYPHLDEEAVRLGATQIAKVCWEYGFRRCRLD